MIVIILMYLIKRLKAQNKLDLIQLIPKMYTKIKTLIIFTKYTNNSIIILKRLL